MLRPPLVVRMLWLAFVVTWLVLAQFNKKARRGTPRWAGWRLRLVIAICLFLLVRFRRHAIAAFFASVNHTRPLHPGVTRGC